jgi:hypothetical protein
MSVRRVLGPQLSHPANGNGQWQRPMAAQLPRHAVGARLDALYPDERSPGRSTGQSMTTEKVFCNHRGIDKRAVEDCARRLNEAGIDAWLKREIAPGDNIVARMEEGPRDRDLALIFFSKAYDPQRPDEGRWLHAEVQSLIYRRIEEGCRVISVMLDTDVNLPVLLKPLAGRGGLYRWWRVQAVTPSCARVALRTQRNPRRACGRRWRSCTG